MMHPRARSFGAKAASYDAVRPRYPEAVIDRIADGSTASVVDAGCGTGIAAAQVAARGLRVVGVEPDPQMAAVAAERGIDVVVAAFEEWAPVERCDLVMSAQAWHWIDARAGAHVAAQAIRPGGSWAAFWNLEVDLDIDAAARSVYLRIAPALLDDRPPAYAGDPAFRSRIENGLADTRCFGPVRVERFVWVDQLTGLRLAERLSTHSAHLMLPADQRREVFDALVDAFGANATLDVRYETELFTADRTQEHVAPLGVVRQ